MKVGSMFAGIGGFDLGFKRAGFEVAWCIEWDKAAQAVLRKRFPEATIYGDIREVDPEQLEKVDVICGGFPCQDLSVAGKRKGLAGERSGLFHDAMRLVRRINPSLLVLENVPGLLSSNRGLDFATVLREVGEGWDCAEVAWRFLDSRYFGVAQRRRRVFFVASAREGCAEQVLALAEGVQWHPAPRDEAREDSPGDAPKCFAGSRESSVTAALETTSHDYSRADGFTTIVGAIGYDIPKQRAQNAAQGHYIAVPIHDKAVSFRKSKRAQTVDDDETWVDDGLANTLNGFDTGDTRTTHAVAFGIDAEMNGSEEIIGCMRRGGEGGSEYAVAFNWQNGGGYGNANEGLGITHDGTGPLQRCQTPAVAFASNLGSQGGDVYTDISPTVRTGSGLGIPSPPAVAMEVAPPLTATNDPSRSPQSAEVTNQVASVVRASRGMVVRRLTPTECERLQGFPDGWTQIGTAEKPTADSHRYKQLGNAVTVNVAEWIARRAMKALKGDA